MSIQDINNARDKISEILREANEMAWVIMANPVWGSAETINTIAIFDTKEQAEAYWAASLLPKDLKPEECKTSDGMFRSFRPDSLLWDYNREAFQYQNISPMRILMNYDGVHQNPPPPSGPIPAVDGLKLDRPKYGRDFDQGSGGPYTNMDGARPEPGHVEVPKELGPEPLKE